MRNGTETLVIGAAGLIGRQVATSFGPRTAKTVHVRPVAGAEPLDVRDGPAVDKVVDRLRPRVVVLAAADPFVERCEREPEATRAVNVGGTLNVQRAAERHDALLVVFSSEYVFDGRTGPYGEQAPMGPLNEYGRQKVEIEEIARRSRHLICRTSGAFGIDDRRSNFVLQLVDRLRAEQDFTVPSDQVITPTYAPSLASALAELVHAGHEGTFHLCGPRVIPRVEFARMIARTFALPVERIKPKRTDDLALAARRPLNAGLSDAKLRGALGHGLMDPAEALRSMALEQA